MVEKGEAPCRMNLNRIRVVNQIFSVPTEKGKKVLTMAEYIERDWLYDQMNSTGAEFDIIDALEMIENFPAADVVEVRHGKWVHSEIEDDDWGRTFHKWTCSVCGYSVAHNPTGENYCPNCGAKMDKEE